MKKILSSYHRKYKFTFKNFKENRKLVLYNFVIRHDISLNELITDTYHTTLTDTLFNNFFPDSNIFRFYAKENLTLRDFK